MQRKNGVGALAGSVLLWLCACADEGMTAGGDDAEADASGDPSAGEAGDDDTGGPDSGPDSGTGSGPDDGDDSDPSASESDSDSDDGTTGSDPPPAVGLCGEPVPPGAEMPAPLPGYSGGSCPAIVPGLNTMTSSGASRTFKVVAPSDLDPSETLPVAFLWHWLGGSADSFIEKADVQNAVDQLRFIAVVPEEKGDLLFRWPFSLIDPDPRMQEEFVFFDDMLACVADSYPIDNNCVTSVGVSAGALFTSQLGWARSNRLASMIVLSGGTGGELIKPWGGASHILPAMVLWGGPNDTCIALNFENTSADLESELTADGHAVVECVHNCGHAQPPFEAPDGQTPYTGMWQFFLDHPYWLDPGESPWSVEGTPEALPQWCDMGVGSAVPRVGECPEPSAC
jgi:predicted esterase